MKYIKIKTCVSTGDCIMTMYHQLNAYHNFKPRSCLFLGLFPGTRRFVGPYDSLGYGRRLHLVFVGSCSEKRLMGKTGSSGGWVPTPEVIFMNVSRLVRELSDTKMALEVKPPTFPYR